MCFPFQPESKASAPLFIIIQPHWSFFCPLNTPGLLQSSCFYFRWSLCLEQSYPGVLPLPPPYSGLTSLVTSEETFLTTLAKSSPSPSPSPFTSTSAYLILIAFISPPGLFPHSLLNWSLSFLWAGTLGWMSAVPRRCLEDQLADFPG